MRVAWAILYGTALGLTVQIVDPLGLGGFFAPAIGFAVAFFTVSSTLRPRCTSRDYNPPPPY